MLQPAILCTVPLFVISSFRVHGCVSQIPHLPTSVVLHDDGQNGSGRFGSRSSSCVMKTHHGSGVWFVNSECWWN